MSPSRVIHICAAAAIGAVAFVVAPAAVQAVESIEVVVYYDVDNDGVRDPGEPGVPGQALSSGDGAITDEAGRAVVTLEDRRTGRPPRVRLSTGWFRSDCAALFCDPDERPDGDNDFGVRNQFIRLEGAVGGGTYHVGIVPDWPGGYPDMPAEFGWNDDGDGLLESGEATGPVNRVDVSTRLSWTFPQTAECKRTGDTADRACWPGDRPRIQFQVMNEGATTLTGVSGVLEMPFESDITATPSTAPLNHPDLGLVFGAYDPVSGAYPWTIDGEMGVGTVAQFVVTTTVPEIVRESVDLAERGQVMVNRVTSVDQWDGTSDADSARCTTGPAPTCSPLVGRHDKQKSVVDDSDDIWFNVIDVEPGNDPGSVHDLALRLERESTDPVDAGDLVPFTIDVVNQGTRNVRNATLVVHPPAGLVFAPPDNPAWSSDRTTVLQGQLAAGATATVTVGLRVDANATVAMNDTSDLRVLAEIADVFDSESGRLRPADVDSRPDLDPANDGYDVTDPWDPIGDDVVLDGESTVGTSAGGEDDQDPAEVAISLGAPACVGERTGSVVSLSFAGDRGSRTHLWRDGSWFAAVTGLDSFVDEAAPDGATYMLRVRANGDVLTDVSCTIETPPGPPICVGLRTGAVVSLSFSGGRGTSANLLRDGVWLAAVTGLVSFVDEAAPDGSTYVLRVRDDGVMTDVACGIV